MAPSRLEGAPETTGAAIWLGTAADLVAPTGVCGCRRCTAWTVRPPDRRWIAAHLAP